jgi:hypothetical protein
MSPWQRRQRSRLLHGSSSSLQTHAALSCESCCLGLDESLLGCGSTVIDGTLCRIKAHRRCAAAAASSVLAAVQFCSFCCKHTGGWEDATQASAIAVYVAVVCAFLTVLSL